MNKIFNKILYHKGDLFGAIIAGIIAFPQALAFGVASGFGAIAGLWGAIILSLTTGFLGENLPLVSGPTAPVAIVLASAYTFISGDISKLILILVMASMLQIIISLTSIPNLIKYVPYPVISGFLSGIGAIIIILQFPVLIGTIAKSSTLETLLHAGQILSNFDINSTILGLSTLFILFFTPKFISKIIPTQLFALIIMTAITYYFNIDVEKISAINATLPQLYLPKLNLEVLYSTFPIALTLAFVASNESLLTGVILDSLTKKKHNSKKLILMQGLGNFICAITGSMLGSAATMRSVAAVKNGAITKLTTILSALFLALVFFKCNWFISQIPICVLAAILIKIGLDIIDFKVFKILNFAPKDDLAVLFAVLFLTIFYNLIFAIAVGIVLSSLLYAKRTADTTVIKEKENVDIYSDYEISIEQKSHYKIRILHLDGHFFFGSISQIVSHFDEMLETEYIILTYDSKTQLDMSAIFALEDIIVRLQSQNIKLLLVITREDVYKNITIMETIINQIGKNSLFDNEKDAIDTAILGLKKQGENL